MPLLVLGKHAGEGYKQIGSISIDLIDTETTRGAVELMALNALTMIVTDQQLQELYRIMIDGDEPAALAVLRVHLRSKVRDAMEGG